MKNLLTLALAIGLAVTSNSIGVWTAGTRPASGPTLSKPESSNAERAQDRPAGLPTDGQAAVSAMLGREDMRYRVEGQGTLEVRNPIQAMRADFAREGIRVEATGGGQWGLALRGWGYGGHLVPVRASEPSPSNHNRVEYRRGSLVEWYVNGPAGLEQGFTISARPESVARNSQVQPAHSLPLTIALAIRGNLTAVASSPDPEVARGRAKDLTLCDGSGHAALRYTGLNARDAGGRELASWMELDGQVLRLRVDDTGARYPVVIDPFIQVARLTAPNGDLTGYFAASVSISRDGSTIVAGAPSTKIGSKVREGAAYVFTHTASGWKQAAKLSPSDGMSGGRFGSSVSVNSDGSTIVAVAAGDRGNDEHVYVFAKSGGGWIQNAEFKNIEARVAAVSGDGNTIAVGCPSRAQAAGAVLVYSNGGGGWSLSATLTAADAKEQEILGYSISISADGSTIVAGAPVNLAGGVSKPGAAYVFVSDGGGWIQAAKLTAAGATRPNLFGQSVNASADGGILVVGAPEDRDGLYGAAYVFTATGNSWTQSAKLTASTPTVYFLGTVLAISPDGNSIVAVAAPATATSVYTKEGSSWKLDGKLTAQGVGIFGSVSLTGDGGTVVGGVPAALPMSYRDGDVEIPRGAAYVFYAGI